MPTGVYERSQAIRDNLRRIMLGTHRHLGHKHSEATKKKMSEDRKGRPAWNKGVTGFKHSEETKIKMGNTRRGVKRPPRSEEWKRKIGDAHRGRKASLETKEKMRLAQTGRVQSEESRRKLSASKMGKPQPWNRGEKNFNWKGGITPVNLAIRGSLEYKLWRESVFKRDNYTCVWCGSKKSGTFNADHIKPFAYYPKLRFSIDNGRTLCVDCHKKTYTYGNRKHVPDEDVV